MFKTQTGENIMNKIITIIAISFFALIGCGNKPNTEDEIDLTNVISMSYQNVLKKTTSAVTCIEDPAINDITDPNFINLGCFFKSGNYYFILNNNSEYVVTNLKISSSNDAFEVTPDSLTTLGVPGKTAGVTPIIRISVNHWSSLETLSICSFVGIVSFRLSTSETTPNVSFRSFRNFFSENSIKSFLFL